MKNFILLFLLIFASLSIFAGENVVLTSTNYVSFIGEFNEQTTSQASQDLMNQCNLKLEDKYLIMYSPGGSVSAGRNFIDFVKGLPCKVHTITIFAASMAYQTVQALDKRYIIPSGVLMSHRATIGGLGGQINGELDSQLAFYKEFVEQLDRKVAKRVGIPLKEYQDSIQNELWLIGENAVNKKHADKIIVPRCSLELMGTKNTTISNPLFGSVNITMSRCPLIIGPVSLDSVAKEKQELVKTYFREITKKEVWYK